MGGRYVMVKSKGRDGRLVMGKYLHRRKGGREGEKAERDVKIFMSKGEREGLEA